MRAGLLGVLALAACDKPEPPPRAAPDLAGYLYGIAGRDEPARAAAVATWTLDRAAWDRVVVEPYRQLHDDYLRELDQARPALVAQLARKRTIIARAHFAGDPGATHAQAITRWALPTLAASRLAEFGGRPPDPIDAVFVEDRGRWRAIVGLGAIVRRRVAALHETCAAVIDDIDPAGGPCIEAAWGVADAALRDDRARFVHACSIAANLCGKRSR